MIRPPSGHGLPMCGEPSKIICPVLYGRRATPVVEIIAKNPPRKKKEKSGRPGETVERCRPSRSGTCCPSGTGRLSRHFVAGAGEIDHAPARLGCSPVAGRAPARPCPRAILFFPSPRHPALAGDSSLCDGPGLQMATLVLCELTASLGGDLSSFIRCAFPGKKRTAKPVAGAITGPGSVFAGPCLPVSQQENDFRPHPHGNLVCTWRILGRARHNGATFFAGLQVIILAQPGPGRAAHVCAGQMPGTRASCCPFPPPKCPGRFPPLADAEMAESPVQNRAPCPPARRPHSIGWKPQTCFRKPERASILPLTCFRLVGKKVWRGSTLMICAGPVVLAEAALAGPVGPPGPPGPGLGTSGGCTPRRPSHIGPGSPTGPKRREGRGPVPSGSPQEVEGLIGFSARQEAMPPPHREPLRLPARSRPSPLVPPAMWVAWGRAPSSFGRKMSICRQRSIWWFGSW